MLIAANRVSGKIQKASTSAAACITMLPLRCSSSSRTTALHRMKHPTAQVSKTGVALSVASHKALPPENSRMTRNNRIASANGTASSANTSITTRCNVPMMPSWLRNTPSAAPKVAPANMALNQPVWIRSSITSMPIRLNNPWTSHSKAQLSNINRNAPPALTASVHTWKCDSG